MDPIVTTQGGAATSPSRAKTPIGLEILREIEVRIGDLYLDPNNPRFADFADRVQPIARDRVVEDGVQRKALDRILDERFEVTQLKDSIRTIGFLPVDRLVVMRLPQPGRYVVIEGNRRIGAIKSLLDDYKNGEADLSAEVVQSLQRLPVLVIEDEDQAKQEHIARILQGVRHVSGIRPWGPYQQAQIVAMMLDDGKDMSEICETLGLPKKRINILRRSFYALAQMRADDDYGDKAKPALFSYFDEILRLPIVRDAWLEWDDEHNRFCSEEHRKALYSWLVGSEDDDGSKYPAKISDPKQIRKLPQLMADVTRFKRFGEDPALGIEEAMQGITSAKPTIEWRDYIQNLLNVLNQVPAVDLEDGSDEDRSLLSRVRNICDNHLKIINHSRT